MNKILSVPIWQWLVLLGVLLFAVVNLDSEALNKAETSSVEAQLEEVLPEDGIRLPVARGDLGKQLVDKGAIDGERFEKIYESRGGLSEYEKALLYGEKNDGLRIDRDNAGVVLNLLWAFGLANSNPVLEEGPMQNPEYGGADQFASTGGWSLAKGDVMDHYSTYELISLTSEQQSLVEEVSKNIYRPCCGNSTYFPDCNHGMAMLGLLELMASHGVSEDEMYKAALAANSYWFPDTYMTLAQYFEGEGTVWSDVDPKVALGYDYSSGAGFRRILAEMEPVSVGGGGSCGV